MNTSFRKLLSFRVLRTVAAALIATVVVVTVWHDYLYTPWTRAGRVNAEVIKIAPEVADKIVQIPVVDNQQVRKGDIVAVIDPSRYKLCLAQAEAKVANCKQVHSQRLLEAKRRDNLLKSMVVSTEESEIANTAVTVALAEYNEAVAARNLAQLDLERTVIRAPTNGVIVNLHARIGCYAEPGIPLLSIIDNDSYWIAAYLEETKLTNVKAGDRAHIRLMGISTEIQGTVDSVSGGIQDENQEHFTGFAAVNPVFTWVRLAQRIPVRIHVTNLPPNVRLFAGQTCSVLITPISAPEPKSQLTTMLNLFRTQAQ